LTWRSRVCLDTEKLLLGDKPVTQQQYFYSRVAKLLPLAGGGWEGEDSAMRKIHPPLTPPAEGGEMSMGQQPHSLDACQQSFDCDSTENACKLGPALRPLRLQSKGS